MLLHARGGPEQAIPEYETVIAFNRNWVFAIFALGDCKFLTGSIQEAIPLIEQAIRLSPRDPAVGIWYQLIGTVHLLQSLTEEAILWLEKASGANPMHPITHAHLASAYGLIGENERAAAELAQARRLNSDGRYSSIARLRTARFWGCRRSAPFTKPLISPACARLDCRRSNGAYVVIGGRSAALLDGAFSWPYCASPGPQ